MNLEHILRQSLELFEVRWDEYQEHLARIILEQGGAKVTFSVNIDSKEIEARFSIGRQSIKAPPVKAQINDENQTEMKGLE